MLARNVGGGDCCEEDGGAYACGPVAVKCVGGGFAKRREDARRKCRGDGFSIVNDSTTI